MEILNCTTCRWVGIDLRAIVDYSTASHIKCGLSGKVLLDIVQNFGNQDAHTCCHAKYGRKSFLGVNISRLNDLVLVKRGNIRGEVGDNEGETGLDNL